MRSRARMVGSISRSGNLHALRSGAELPGRTPDRACDDSQSLSEVSSAVGQCRTRCCSGFDGDRVEGRRGRDLYGQVSGRVTGQVGGAAEPEQPAASTGRLTSIEGCIEAPPKKGEINLKVGRVTLMCITEEALV